MPSLRDIETRIVEDFPRDTMPLRLARAVWNLGPDGSAYLSLPLLEQLATTDDAVTRGTRAAEGSSRYAFTKSFTPKALRAIYDWAEYLASERIGLLEQRLELIVDDSELPLQIDAEAFADALETGKLHDPRTGAPVPDWKKRLVIFYTASDTLLEILRGQSR